MTKRELLERIECLEKLIEENLFKVETHKGMFISFKKLELRGQMKEFFDAMTRSDEKWQDMRRMLDMIAKKQGFEFHRVEEHTNPAHFELRPIVNMSSTMPTNIKIKVERKKQNARKKNT